MVRLLKEVEQSRIPVETGQDSGDSFICGTTFLLRDKSEIMIMFSCQEKSTQLQIILGVNLC